MRGGGVRRRRGVGGGGRGGGGDGDLRELGRVGHDAAPRPSSVVVDLVLSIVVVVVVVAAAAAAAAASDDDGPSPPAAGAKSVSSSRRKRAAAGGLRRRLGSGEHLLPAERVGAVGVERPELAAELAEGGAKVAAEERAVAREALPPLLRRDGAVAVGVERVEERHEDGAALGRAQRLRERERFKGDDGASVDGASLALDEKKPGFPPSEPVAASASRRARFAGGEPRLAAGAARRSRARLPDAVEVREVAPAGDAPARRRARPARVQRRERACASLAVECAERARPVLVVHVADAAHGARRNAGRRGCRD